jgi:hypothetical protein
MTNASLSNSILPPAAASVPLDRELLDRIQAHPFDEPGAAPSFGQRLARENGWPSAFANRVVAEYRRFVYLACTAPTEVTPSDEVDQAWHLHLTYTRNYWEAFCPNVLGRPLHHNPSSGGPAEELRYRANYRGTLVLYKEVFGTAPPPDIWPPEQVRFAKGGQYGRVNRALFTVMPHAQYNKATRVVALGALSLVLVSFALAIFVGITTVSALRGTGSWIAPAIGSLVLMFWLAHLRPAIDQLASDGEETRRSPSGRAASPAAASRPAARPTSSPAYQYPHYYPVGVAAPADSDPQTAPPVEIRTIPTEPSSSDFGGCGASCGGGFSSCS